jgi:ergothioneine biosynthesis protein EgtB
MPTAAASSTAGALDPTVLLDRYRAVRAFTEALCEPLTTEDYVIQTMPDVSPTKWHLAHTTWFFETFLLVEHAPLYEVLHPKYNYLFNSYYNAVGYRHCRPKRGLISRPTVAEVYDYRRYVDQAVERFLGRAGEEALAQIAPVIELGLHHEQQHQELMVTDIKHVFSENPLFPAYRERMTPRAAPVAPVRWLGREGGLSWTGHEGGGFHFDNEGPRHRTWLEPFELASRLVTNGEYLNFMADGGYERHDLWLSMGWAWVQEENRRAPMYWQDHEGRWRLYTLSGVRAVDPGEPVVHLSYFEADAFARWAGARLPSEQEWEAVAAERPIAGNLADSGIFHPTAAPSKDAEATDGPPEIHQLFGDVWEWTRSDYAAYPGYQPAAGALGEYNGKFMSGQYVLRGGSCATSSNHLRATYRNFFPPDARWQFSGLRLARDAK